MVDNLTMDVLLMHGKGDPVKVIIIYSMMKVIRFVVGIQKVWKIEDFEMFRNM